MSPTSLDGKNTKMDISTNLKVNVKPKEVCDHCGNEIRLVRIESKIEESSRLFCCEGCETVYSLIHSIGGDYYYRLKGRTILDPVKNNSETNEDTDEFTYQKFVRKTATHSEVTIQITNIHCSACVWLNEKVLNEEEGIFQANINFTTARVKVKFDETKINLSRILNLIKAIGYKPILFLEGNSQKEKNNYLKSLFLRIGVAGFSFGNIMIVSVALYSGYFSGIDLEFKRLFHYVSWAFATPAYLYSGYPFFLGFIRSIQRKNLSMDFLLFFGISLAYFYSIYVTLTDRGEVYFDSVAMIYFFILIGKYFEEKARVFASERIESLLCKLPETSILIQDNEETKIVSSEIKTGHSIKVAPGKRIPVDALLVSESAYVDESFLTGESLPILKNKGDSVLAGSLAIDSPLYLVAKSDYQNSTLSSLKLRLEEALHLKPKIQILTEKIASYFISTVFTLSIITFIIWYIKSGGNVEESLLPMIAVLIVACPCALGIAVPTALVTNHILNANKGVLLKNPSVVEKLDNTTEVFLDKTGTLTEGKFLVQESNIEEQYLPIIYKIEKNLEHPLAKSLVRYFEKIESLVVKAKEITVSNLVNVPGKGVMAEVQGKSGVKSFYRLGNLSFLDSKESIPKSETGSELDTEGTFIYLERDGVYLGYLKLADQIRPGAKEFVSSLQRIFKKVTMISGDRESSVSQLANRLNLNFFKSNLSPEQKREMVLSSQSAGETVLMVGDGINDSLALGVADVAISHSEAEDLSLERSDIVLTSGNLTGILYSVHSAKVTRRVILQNIILSLCYNSIMLPLAMFGLMLPVICSLFMALSSLTVLINSILIRARLSNWKLST
ncbi:MAG: heavy metal translocating P-type ATPase [Leptospira sp.]|nr:heavy metal translocating P-type ATPase [Leptospira sp.]